MRRWRSRQTAPNRSWTVTTSSCAMVRGRSRCSRRRSEAPLARVSELGRLPQSSNDPDEQMKVGTHVPGHRRRPCLAPKRAAVRLRRLVFLKRPAPWRRTGLRVARSGEEFVDCDHRGASDDGDCRHHENSFEHGSLPTLFDAKDARRIRFRQDQRTTGAGWKCGVRSGAVSLIRLTTLRLYSIANALETIAIGLLSVAERSVTRPKLMVRPRRTTRASASTSEADTARMKCVVWSTVVIAR
jgi:hypothetical protein